MFYRQFLLYTLILTIIDPTAADIYLHNPRGTNNRHNENTPERRTPNLSFDSQNNNRGGYNVGDDGSIYYYTKSILPIQWTNQHSCNDVNTDCTILFQYMCADTLRDGNSTETIPVTVEAEQDSKYRLTEDLTSYLYCAVRSRNKNLFTAAQGLRESSTYTRQNPGGNRYGYECPEERDYYPYWQPTNWIDIAILTNRQDLCSYYRANSQNVQSRFACTFNTKADLIIAHSLGIILPNTKDQCEAFNDRRFNGTKPSWREFPSHNQPPPECFAPAYTRENHLGDTVGSDMPVYNWTLPSQSARKCVLRVRYNISTGDYDAWKTDSSSNNGNLYIMKKYFPNETVAEKRGYRFQDNPNIQLFENLNLTFQLAINTNQYGRVFEDRSFTFEIRQRPIEYQDKPIYNLNVRGRRGNIVQVYPAVEYDFVPNRLEISPNSYVHIQWIGSNTTPPGAGQGNREIDRNNLLLLKNNKINSSWNQFQYLNFTGLLIANLPELLNQTNFLNLPIRDLRRLAASGENTDPLLYNASAYFDLNARLIPETSSGIYHFVSTRNNDFSNRDQKGRVIVQPYQFKYQFIGEYGQKIQLENTILTIPDSSLEKSTSIKFSKYTRDQLSKILPENGQNIVEKENLYNSIYVIEPHDQQFNQDISIQIPINVFDNNVDDVDVLRFEPRGGIYLKLKSSIDSNNRMVKFQTDKAGVFVFIEKSPNPIWIAGIIIPFVLLFIIVVSTVVYFKANPNRYKRIKNQFSQTKRSFFSNI